MAAPTKLPTLVQFDRELRDRLDRYAAAEFAGNRSRAVHEACELLLSQHAALVQRQRQEPARGGWLPPPRHTADTTVAAGSRPLTADLMDRG